MLDYCRTVNFNRSNKGSSLASASTVSIADEATEIDGDAFLSVINAKPQEQDKSEDPLNSSIMMEDHLG